MTVLWAARNPFSNIIHVFKKKPEFVQGSFWRCEGNDTGIASFYEDVLPELTFENSPKQVELKLHV